MLAGATTSSPHTPFVTGNLHFVKNPFSGPRRLPKLWSMRFDFEKFYQAVNAKREERAASWRQVAREIGIGKSTLARMAQNKRPDADGLAALSFWADINPAHFVFVEQPCTAAVHDCAATVGSAISA
jgi:hypothetical protein